MFNPKKVYKKLFKSYKNLNDKKLMNIVKNLNITNILLLRFTLINLQFYINIKLMMLIFYSFTPELIK